MSKSSFAWLRGWPKMKSFLGTHSDLICGNGPDCDELLVSLLSSLDVDACSRRLLLLPSAMA